MIARLEKLSREVRTIRPAVLLFTAALAFIFIFTLDFCTIPILALLIGVFIWHGWRGGLDKCFLMVSLLVLLLIAVPIFREFKLERDKVKEISSKEVPWRGRIIIPAVADSSKWGEAVLRLDSGPLVAVRGDPQQLKAGNVIESTTRLKIPPAQRNPGGFDRRAQLKSQGIFLEVFLGQKLQIKEQKPSLLSHWRNLTADLQGSACEFFQRTLDSDTAGLATAICLGRTGGITPRENYVFKESGLIHLVSVSGAHLGFLLAPLRQVKAINKKAKDYLSLTMLFSFGIISGWRTGVSRACLMILLRKYSRRRELALDEISLLAVTGLILLIDPFRALQRGYWLSLGATAGIRLGVPPLLSWLGIKSDFGSNNIIMPPLAVADNSLLQLTCKFCQKLRGAIDRLVSRVFQLLAITCCAQIVCVFPSLYWQSGINPLSLISNVVAGIPAALITAGGIFGLFILAPLVFILPAVSSPLLAIWSFAIRQAVNVLRSLAVSCSGAKGGFIGSGEMGKAGQVIILLAALYIGLALFMQKPFYVLRRFLELCLLFALLVGFFGQKGTERNEVWFLDVGQGDCCLLQISDKIVLIDGGERDQGYYTVMPFLRYRGIDKIDIAIVTHGHSDHCGGIIDLLEQDMISRVVMPNTGVENIATDSSDYVQQDLSMDLVRLATQRQIPVSYRSAGDKIVLEDGLLSLDFLSPNMKQADNIQKYLPADPNRDSIVIHCRLLWLSLLLTADATLELEDSLVLEYQEGLRAHLLKVAHHGSKYASCDKFLGRVKPQIAVISVGLNHFGHPAGETLARLEDAGCQEILRTDQRGAVRLHVEEKRVRISTWLDKKKVWIIQR
ncbi:MAG TPA: DUF4131 domain-containing protein [Clostridiaceae bacterium]|nr:DUF4131 domain-containing protein [Clostridiaceae bacterium]